MTNSSMAQQRQEKHSQIKALMRQGELNQALNFIEKTVSDLGPHIGLLCDMAACQYELGLFHSCSRTLQLIKHEYLQVADVLSPSSSRKSALFLSKLLEEQGEVAEALNYLSIARKYASEVNEFKMIASQELRILAWLGDHKNLSEKYLLLTELEIAEDGVKIEVLHGLMWAEWSLFGFSHAEERWKALQKLPLHLMDKRLIARDFLEIVCLSRQSHCASAELSKKILQDNEPLPYDRFLILAYSKDELAFLSEHTDGCSVMMKLRILLIQLQLSNSGEIQIEVRKKINFLLSGLTKPSTQLLKRLIPETLVNEVAEITISRNKQLAQLHSDTINLTQQQHQLIVSFSNLQTLELSSAVQILWQAEWDESYYHRLRMLVYKINYAFETNLGGPVFEIRKDGITLSKNLKILVN